MAKRKKRRLSRHGERVLRRLGYELIDAVNKYGQFKLLFQSGQENLDLMHSTASNFFEFYGESAVRDVIMTLARLSDRPIVAGKDTLVFERLAGELPPRVKRRYLSKLKNLQKRLKPLRKWRNERLAHNGLAQALRTKKLPVLRYNRIQACIHDASALLNIVNEYKEEGHTGYDMAMVSHGADFLINHLEMAKTAYERGLHLPEGLQLP